MSSRAIQQSQSPIMAFSVMVFSAKMPSVVQCPILNAISHDPMKVSNSCLHAFSRADVIIFLAMQRRLAGWKDEHIPRGFPVHVLNSGTMMEVVKSFGVVTVFSIRLNSSSKHLCRFSLPNLH